MKKIILTEDQLKSLIDHQLNEEISAIKRDRKDEFFNYDTAIQEVWNKPFSLAKDFQRITFDLENDSSDSKKTFYVKKNLRKDQPIKYEVQAEMRIAGGDWEMPVIYFRVEFINSYGNIFSNKYESNPEYVWDVKGYPIGHKVCLIPPVEAGNKLVKGESDSGKYDWFAYQNSELSKEDEKKARLTDADKAKAWKWIEEFIEKVIDSRHEMID